MKKSNPLKWIILAIAVAINVFIIVNACISGPTSAQESGNVSTLIANIINAFVKDTINESNFEIFAFNVRKLVGHFAVFVFDGFFSSLAFYLFLKDNKFGRWYWLTSFSLGFGLIVAMVSELIQIFTPERYGTWGDIAIDFSGYILGFVIIFSCLLFFDFIDIRKETNIEDLE